jgi:uncharacterized membrane protein
VTSGAELGTPEAGARGDKPRSSGLRAVLRWRVLREGPSPAALRSMLLVGTIAGSIVLFVQELFGPKLVDFVKSNALAFPARKHVVLAAGIAFALAAIGAVVYAWRRDEARLERVAHRLAPLALLGVLPPLCVPEAWPDPLTAAIAVACFVFLAERLVRLSLATFPAATAPTLGPDRPPTQLGRALVLVRRWAPVCLVVAGAVGYAIYMSVFTLRLHGRFGTYGYDLGQQDNVFFNTLHGRPLRDVPLGLTENWSEIRNHADWSTYFFLPVYALKPGAPVLLVLQSCVLGLGAIPLYRFASRHLSRASACVIALSYLLYPPMHGMQFYDFHFQPIASTFVLFVIDFVEERRYVPCAIAFVVALGCREDVSIGLAILGAFLVLSGSRLRRAGTVIAAVAGAYFVLIRFVIMPRLGATNFGVWTASYIYKDLIPQGGENISGVMTTLVTNPAYVLSTLATADKLRYALQILLPLALLPLRRGYLAVSLVHGSLLTLLTTRYGPTIDIGFQYSANFIPYIFPAAVLALERLGGEPDGKARRGAALAAVIAGTLLCGVFWGAIPPRKLFHGGFDTLPMTAPTAADGRKHADLVELNSMVPPEASVAVSEHEMPHISRFNMVTLRDTADAEYLLYAPGSHGSANGERALARGECEKIAERPGLVLCRKKQR